MRMFLTLLAHVCLTGRQRAGRTELNLVLDETGSLEMGHNLGQNEGQMQRATSSLTVAFACNPSKGGGARQSSGLAGLGYSTDLR